MKNNAILSAFSSSAVYSQFGTWILLLDPICLASLVESGHSFSSLGQRGGLQVGSDSIVFWGKMDAG